MVGTLDFVLVWLNVTRAHTRNPGGAGCWTRSSSGEEVQG